MSSVSIYLIRNNSYPDKSQTDDKAIITFNNDSLDVKYIDRQCNKTTEHCLHLEKNGLAKYVKNIGYLFLTDTEPFTQIQFNFPGFPSYMLTREALKNTDTQDALMEIASMVNESWINEDDALPPLISLPRGNTASRPLPRHEYYDDEPYSGHY
jgi:hypothetical protein